MIIHISGRQTDHQLGLIEEMIEPGGDSGLHVHPDQDESMFLVAGELEVTIGNLQFIVRAGESYFAPRNMPHRLRNTAKQEARALFIETPACLGDTAREAGIRMLVPPFQEGTAEYGGKPPIYKRPVYKRTPDTYFFFGVPTVIHLAGLETGNEFSLLESVMANGCDSGLHVHANEDECLYLLSGELELVIGDQSKVFKAGTSCFVPRNTPHRLRNKRSKTAHVLHINTPATLDPFIRLAGIHIKSPSEVVAAYPSPDQIGPILLLSEEYDFHMLIPPGV